MSTVSIPVSATWDVEGNHATLTTEGSIRPPFDVTVTAWQPYEEPGERREVYMQVTDAAGHYLHDFERHGAPIGRFESVNAALSVATAWYLGWLEDAAQPDDVRPPV